MTHTNRLLGLGLLAATITFAQSNHNGDLNILGNLSAANGISTAPIKTVSADPTGSCTLTPGAMVLNISGGSQSGHISACIGGGWQLVGSGSGSVPSAGIIKSTGSSFVDATPGVDYQTPLTLPLSIANGGTGIATSPTLTGGSGIQITGQWPTWTVTNIGGGGSGNASGNATSIQGNVVKSGIPSSNGQAYLWNVANNDFELGAVSAALPTSGSGNFVESVSPTLITPSFGQSGPTLTYMTGGSVTANLLVSADSSGRAIQTTTGGNGFGIAASTVTGAGNNVEVQTTGLGQCVMDGPSTVGHVAVASSTVAGDCSDSTYSASSSISPTVAVVGMIRSATTTAGQLSRIQLHGPGAFGTLQSGGSGGTGSGGGTSTGSGSIAAIGAGTIVSQAGNGTYTVNVDYTTNTAEKAVTGYTIQQSDQDKYILYTGSAAAAWVIPVANTPGSGAFQDGYMTTICNMGSATLTLSPNSGSTINGAASATISGCALVHSDGTNYELTQAGSGGSSGGGGGSGSVSAPLTLTASTSAAILNVANTLASGYTIISVQGTGHTYQYGVGNAAASGLANDFYIYDQTAGGNLLKYDPTVSNWTFLNAGTVVLTNQTLTSAVNTVAYSATPTFNLSDGNLQKITLTGNVTSSTISSLSPGKYTFQVCQDATGGRTFSWPANVKGAMIVGTTASKCSVQEFASFDGATLYPVALGYTNQ